MKLKNLMLMSLFLMAILTIGAVSAADNATDALAVEDDGDESLEASLTDDDSLSLEAEEN